jgi:methylaspartate ammonia-lyase
VLAISLDKVSQKLMGLDVNTYIDEPEDKVVFNVTYKDLPDGTQYSVSTSLVAAAKDLKIVIENSGYKKGAGN